MLAQQLKNDVAVITGAASDVGRAIARALAEQGARIALFTKNVKELETAARELRERGAESMLFGLDVADSKAVGQAADRILAEWGPIDLWVNNGRVSAFAPDSETEPHGYRRSIRVSYLDHLHGTQAALRHMRPHNRGVILQISSALAYRAVPPHSAYAASKAAIRYFTDSLRSELIRAGSGIAVTMLHLPAVSTPQSEVVRRRLKHHPESVPPIYPPEVIAQAAVYAALQWKQERWLGSGPTQSVSVKTSSPGFSITPHPSVRRLRARRTRPVVYALLGLSAAALAFGPVRRWAREHSRFSDRSR